LKRALTCWELAEWVERHLLLLVVLHLYHLRLQGLQWLLLLTLQGQWVLMELEWICWVQG